MISKTKRRRLSVERCETEPRTPPDATPHHTPRRKGQTKKSREATHAAPATQPQSRTHQTGALRVVAAGVRRPRLRVTAGMVRHDEGVELSHEGHRRPGPIAFQYGPHAGEGQASLGGKAGLGEHRLHTLCCLHLLEPELGLIHDRLADADDTIPMPVDGIAHSLLQTFSVTHRLPQSISARVKAWVVHLWVRPGGD